MNISKVIRAITKVSNNYARKFGIRRDNNWYILKLQEELGELIQSYLMMTGKARQKDKSKAQIEAEFKKEVADVFCQVLLLAKRFNVDLEQEVKTKWLIYNPESDQDLS
jgi:NTP pyrophosphatase (non-canonical NTP hydrolase)